MNAITKSTRYELKKSLRGTIRRLGSKDCAQTVFNKFTSMFKLTYLSIIFPFKGGISRPSGNKLERKLD